MVDDILDRLRDRRNDGHLNRLAAEEIERLRAIVSCFAELREAAEAAREE